MGDLDSIGMLDCLSERSDPIESLGTTCRAFKGLRMISENPIVCVWGNSSYPRRSRELPTQVYQVDEPDPKVLFVPPPKGRICHTEKDCVPSIGTSCLGSVRTVRPGQTFGLVSCALLSSPLSRTLFLLRFPPNGRNVPILAVRQDTPVVINSRLV